MLYSRIGDGLATQIVLAVPRQCFHKHLLHLSARCSSKQASASSDVPTVAILRRAADVTAQRGGYGILSATAECGAAFCFASRFEIGCEGFAGTVQITKPAVAQTMVA